MPLHSVRFLRQLVDDQLLLITPPSPHLIVRVNDITHVVGNILLLSTFIMKRNSTTSQWPKDIFDIDLRAASNTNMQVWKAQADKVLQKVKDIFSWGWHPRVGTLVERVNDDINWLLCGDEEHFPKTRLQDIIAGLLPALPMCGINAGDYLAAGARVGRKLNEKRRDKVAEVLLFVFVPKVKVEIC